MPSFGSYMNDFQKKILNFYKQEGRDLPWRHTTDRYYIMVSEIMLQQTQVSRVIPKYVNWIEQFPTIQDLASANLSDVLTAWSGLGYNSRGKRLWECAKVIVEQYKGKVPDNVDELQSLPGIGPYTSRSILIFADNKDVATVDTNIRRILIHELKLNESISDKELFVLAQDLVPKGKSRDWHNALMDYGSTILTVQKTGIKPKTKQSPFKTSKRYYRGQILKHLTTHKKITVEEALQKHIPENKHNIKTILQELEAEEIIANKGTHYEIV